MTVVKRAHEFLWAGVFAFFACSVGCTPAAEEVEKQHLEQARARVGQTIPESQSVKTAEPIPIADVPMSIMMEYDNLSPLMQGYFGDDSSTARLIENLKRDPDPLMAPVVIRVRWIPLDLNRGKGEIAAVYDRPVDSFEQLQPVANALLKYRNHVGGAFDMRLLSFEMFIAGTGVEGCGFPLLNTSGLTYGLVSPCLSIDDEKVCTNEDGSMSANMKTALHRCFKN